MLAWKASAEMDIDYSKDLFRIFPSPALPALAYGEDSTEKDSNTFEKLFGHLPKFFHVVAF